MVEASWVLDLSVAGAASGSNDSANSAWHSGTAASLIGALGQVTDHEAAGSTAQQQPGVNAARSAWTPDFGMGARVWREDAAGVSSMPVGWWEKAGYTSSVLDQLCPNVRTTKGWDGYRRACKAAGRLCVAAHRADAAARDWRMTADTLTAPDDGQLPTAWPIMTDIVDVLAHRYRWSDEIIGSLQYLTVPGLSDPAEAQVIGAAWCQAWSGDVDGLTRVRDLLTDTYAGDAATEASTEALTRADRCLARLTLSQEVVAWLDQRPNPGHEVRPHVGCDLELGHPGPHAVMGQQSPDAEWWVRWTLDASEVVEQPGCPAEGEIINDRGDRALCLLYQGHPGRHSFEF